MPYKSYLLTSSSSGEPSIPLSILGLPWNSYNEWMNERSLVQSLTQRTLLLKAKIFNCFAMTVKYSVA